MITTTETKAAFAAEVENEAPAEESAFLALLPARLRGSMKNAFLNNGPRRSVTDTAAIVAAVYALFERRQERAMTPQDAEGYGAVLSALTLHEDKAHEFAAQCIAYHALPEEARQERKQAMAADHVARWMQGQQPTEKQMACLNRIGYIGAVPADRAEASRLIHSLRKGSEVTR